MNISELALKRPILATVMNLLIILFGVVGYSFLSVREYPAIDPPIVNVRTSYAGANADIIESQITEPLEKSINGIPGIKTINSSSNNGSSNITIEFDVNQDLEAAANDVRDKVSQAARSLPQDVDAPPVVSKSDASSDFILLMAVQSKTKGLMELSEYAENVLQERLQTIPEVSSVSIFGQKRPAMRIWIDPNKLNAFNLTYSDFRTALNRENVEIPSGKLYGNKTEMTIRALGKLQTEDDFKNLIIVENATGIIRLKDIAKVEIGPEQEEYGWKLNGINGVGIIISPQPGANYIKIADEFYKRIEDIKKNEKGDFEFTPLIDQTKNVRRAIKEVEETLLILSLIHI
jgi:multidrug efflux pump subunit AcrB